MRLFLLLITIAFFGQLYAQHPEKCGYDMGLSRLISQRPEIQAELEEYSRQISELERMGAEMVGSRAVVTIPVVFHVIHSGEVEGVQRNLSSTRIQQQMDRLNADFRRTNTDASNTPTMFRNVAADCEIQFCLANRNPQGTTTTGITRHRYNNIADQDYIENVIKPATTWDATRYLNIWTVEMPNDMSDVLGYAYPPLPAIVGTNIDGLVLNYLNCGNNPNSNPVSIGRTATHEIGHYLGLAHTWANHSNIGGCAEDDGISDTPNSDQPYYGCPSHPQMSCGNTNMPMNFMDYPDDNCMNLFTLGQKSVMRAVLASSTSYNSTNGAFFRGRLALVNNAGTACSTPPVGNCRDLSTNPIVMGFESGELLTDWATENSNNDQNNSLAVTWKTSAAPTGTNANDYGPKTGSRFIMYFWNTDGVTVANDWLFTPCINFVSGRTYRLKFSYAVGRDGTSTYPERFKVTLNSAQTSASQIAVLSDYGTVSNAFPGYIEDIQDFTITTGGEACIGFHCYSIANQYALQIDDINISDITLDVNEPIAEEMMSVYPNPANEELIIKADIAASDDMQLTVFNALGQMIYKQANDWPLSKTLGLNVSEWPAGVYYVSLVRGENTLTKTVLIQH